MSDGAPTARRGTWPRSPPLARGARFDPDRGGPRCAARGRGPARRGGGVVQPGIGARRGHSRCSGTAERGRPARAGRGGPRRGARQARVRARPRLDAPVRDRCGVRGNRADARGVVRARGFVMGSLGLHADPDGWLNAGYSIRTLMDSLDSELYDADRIGGAGLSQSWAGPVAEAFNGNWSGLRSRAEDLIAQGRRAAGAIIDFGGRLEDFVKRATDLERYWLSFGLQLGLDGMHFALPWGFEQVSPVHQVSFHQWLTESERDVTAMWSDIRAAVDDVVTALESLIAAFEDYAALEVGTAAGLIGGDLGGYRTNWVSAISDGVTVATTGLDWARNHVLDEAYKKVIAASEDASHDAQAAADTATKDALRTAAFAGKLDRV